MLLVHFIENSIYKVSFKIQANWGILMGKKISMILIFVFLLGILTACYTGHEVISKGNVFANPRQFGEFALYGQYNNEFKFYKPVSKVEDSKAGNTLLNKVNFSPLDGKNIFDYDENLLFIVEHTDDESGDVLQHMQLQYISKDRLFIVFSAYEVKNFDLDLANQDMFGNQVNTYNLNDETVIQVLLTTNTALTYTYYTYNEKDSFVNLVNTAGNEIFTYKDGILYHVAYNIDIDNEVLFDVFERFIK